MATPDVEVEQLHSLLRRLQGVGGYSTDDAGPRDRELLAVAHVLAVAMLTIDAASEQSFQSRATHLLEEWEREYRLPNDAARSIEERQARLVGAESAVGGADLTTVQNALRAIAAGASPAVIFREQVSQDAATADCIFQAAVQLTQGQWESPATRKAIKAVMERLLPAENWGQHQQPDLEDSIAVNFDASWASATHVLGRDVIRKQSAVAYSVRAPTCRRRNYGPISKLRATDLNAIQDDLLWKGSTSLLEALPGADMIAFAVHAAGASTTQVDASVDWRDRYLASFLAWDINDIRPGQAGDAIGGLATKAAALVYSGTGGAATGYQWDFGGGLALDLVVNAATGALEIVNGEVNDHYIVGLIFASRDLLGGGVIQTRLVDFVDGNTLATMPASFATSLRDRSQIRKAAGTGADAWAAFAGKGGVHRLGCLVKTQRPGASFNTYVLDTENDWRDRVASIIVSHAVGPATGGVIPGVAEDDKFTPVASNVHYMQAGSAAAAALNGTHFRVHDSGNVRVVARSSDGALLLERSSAHSEANQVAYLVRIISSERLGIRGAAPTAIPALVAVDNQVVVPADLNLLQDLAELGQFRGAGLACMSLGTLDRVHSGVSPALPAVHTVRGAEVRQRSAVGAARRFFSKSIANNGNIVLDSSVDWRRRFIWGVGRWTDGGAGFDIRPGEAQASTHNAADQWADSSTYLADGALGVWTSGDTGLYLWIAGKGTTSSISIYVDATNGQLMIENRRGATAHVTGWIEASFQIVPAPIPAN